MSGGQGMVQQAIQQMSLVDTLRELYVGQTARARQFRLGFLVFDILSIVFFIATSAARHEMWVVVIDVILATIILADLLARYLIAGGARRFFRSLETWTDIVVIGSLLAAAFFENLLFLRAFRLLRSYRVIADLAVLSPTIRRNHEMIIAVANVVIFMFVTASLVFVLQANSNPKIIDYFDALYFTITTLTTTGFGDITLVGKSGQILSILIMLIGVSLFLRMLQTIFRPNKVRFPCPDCGLQRHDIDAVHCKACGQILNIPDDGVV